MTRTGRSLPLPALLAIGLLAGLATPKARACVVDTDCTSPPSQCKRFECQSGTCVEVADPNTELDPCNDGNKCTLGERCDNAGSCNPPLKCGRGTDPNDESCDDDGDGDCDADEVACGCDPNDDAEVCPLPNRLVGKAGSITGEILIQWNTPTVRRVNPGTDDSCSAVGECTGGYCTKGRIRDVCTAAVDCALPPDTCRVIVNWADTADLLLDYARLGQEDAPGFVVTPACSRKVDLLIGPAQRRILRLRARGTVDKRVRRDRDILRYQR